MYSTRSVRSNSRFGRFTAIESAKPKLSAQTRAWRAAQREGAPQFGWDFGLVLGALACTVAGYYALLPLMDAARAGQGALGFGQLHAVSAAFYAVKLLLVLALAWRAARA